MNFIWWRKCLLISMLAPIASQEVPNILFFMVDDMGWNDVSFHGGDQIMTPNLDAMAYQGVILQQYYSEAICTPARTSLLTGKYAMRLGMQGFPLYNAEDRGIPVKERLLPSYLKDLGYSTHLVGKWHVGMSREEFLPIFRGYDTHYGMRGGFVDYYTYNKVEDWPDGDQYVGLDLFDGMDPQINEDRYLVDALTDRAIKVIENHNKSRPLFLHVTHNAPHAGNDGSALQPPPQLSLKNKHIAHSNRRLYADVVTHLDQSFGFLIEALNKKQMLQNTIVIFISDNGAPTIGKFRNWGVNLPFRGQKYTPWEGAVRVPAFIWHPSLKPKIWNGLMHITDWLPTLIAAAGGKPISEIDGINQWNSLNKDSESNRKEVLVSIDNLRYYASYRYGDYKIVIGNVSNAVHNKHYGKELMKNKEQPPPYMLELLSSRVTENLQNIGFEFDYEKINETRIAASVRQQDTETDSRRCIPTANKGCLYNLLKDPCENHDLWDVAQPIANILMTRLHALWNEQLPREYAVKDERGNPARNNFIWMPWLHEQNFDNNFIHRESKNVKFNKTDESKLINKCNSDNSIRNLICILRNVF